MCSCHFSSHRQKPLFSPSYILNLLFLTRMSSFQGATNACYYEGVLQSRSKLEPKNAQLLKSQSHLGISDINFQHKTSFRKLSSNSFYLEVMILQLKWKLFESHFSPPWVQMSYLFMTEGVFSCSAIFFFLIVKL